MENKIIKSKDGAGFKGIHTLNICSAESPEAKKIMNKLDWLGTTRWLLMAQFKQKEAAEFVAKRFDNILELQKKLDERLKSLHEEFQYLNNILNQKFLLRSETIENVTCNNGRGAIAGRLAGITTYTGVVNYCALGDDATAAGITNATLGNEVFRKALSTGALSNQTAYLETFFNYTDVNGTFEEFGFFIDGTGSADTGQLMNRFTQSTTKTALESLNVQSQISLTDV